MEKLDSIKNKCTTFIVLCVVTAFLGGCGVMHQSSPLYHPTAPFPAPIPETSSISVNLNGQGKFFIADKDGNPLFVEPVPLSFLLRESDEKSMDRLMVLGSFSLHRITGNNTLWICDNEFRCAVESVKDKTNAAVFSVNYDGQRLFLSDSQGEPIVKDLRPFSELIQNTRFSEQVGLETLSVFNAYQIKGSIKIAFCSANNMCFCVCYNPYTHEIKACSSGNCPG